MKTSGLLLKSYLTLTLTMLPFQAVGAQEFKLSEHPPIVLEEKSPELELTLFKKQKEPWRAVALNILPFGVGSFQQGDYLGGIAIAIIDGLNTFLIINGSLERLKNSEVPIRPSRSIASVMGMFLLLGIGRFVGFLAPHLHYEAALKDFTQKQNNEKLDSILTPTSQSLLNFSYTF
jgi:hypothetical protein